MHMPKHTCERNSENCEANSTWITAIYLHLFRANTQLLIDVLRLELLKNYRIKCCKQRLYRAKNKALKLFSQDHKASFIKLFRYMHAILASLVKVWLGGGVNPYFNKFLYSFMLVRGGFF